MEKLIPFDFAAFKKDPTRLRIELSDGQFVSPIWAEPVHDCVAVMELINGEGVSDMYAPDDFYRLRLAVKIRKVRVRLFMFNDGEIGVANDTSSTINGLYSISGYRWVSEPVEIEITK